MKLFLQFLVCSLSTLLIINSCKKEYSCETCGQTNKPPVANAGKDTTVNLPVDSILLDGSGSFDPEGKISSYQWAQVSGPVPSDIAKASLSKTHVKGLAAGVYQFELTVTDNENLFARDTVQVTVSAASANLSPVADAGNDTTIKIAQNSCLAAPVSFSLNGTKSYDPD